MNNQAKPLPMDIIREALELDSTSPTFLRWKTRPRHHFNSDKGWRCFNTRDAGQVACSVCDDGLKRKYWALTIGGKTYKAHRLVVALAFGVDPAGLHVDHRDGNGLNNAPENLRLATRSLNGMNRGATRNNTSGHKGVGWYKRLQKWQAQIKISGRTRHLGLFNSSDDAAAAYERASREFFGEFHHQPKLTTNQ